MKKIIKSERLINFSIFLISLIGTLCVVEYVLSRMTGLTTVEKKVWVLTSRGWGNCYTSDNAHYLPLDLRNQKDWDTVKPLLPDTLRDQLVKETPHCIFYDVDKRLKGFFPERTKKAVIIGDSSAFGEGLKDEDTLAYLLSAKFKEINFPNYGYPGADIGYTYQTALILMQTDNRIKKIIYFYNLNDLLDQENTPDLGKEVLDFHNLRWENWKNPQGWINVILAKTRLGTMLLKTMALRKESDLTVKRYLDSYFSVAKRDRFVKSMIMLSLMNKAAIAHGIDLQVAIYPLLYKDSLGRYPFVPIHNLLKEVCLQYSISCIDLYPAFADTFSLKDFTISSIDYHPNGLANRKVVDYLIQKDRLKFEELK